MHMYPLKLWFLSKGLWTGLTICVLMQSIFFLTFLSRLDWKKVAQEVCAYILLSIQNVAFYFILRYI